MDLTFYTTIKSKNRGYHVLLTIINMNTRFLYVYAFKSTKVEPIRDALEDFISKNDPVSISCDKGREFDNILIHDLLEENEIQFIIFNKSDKNNDRTRHTSIIERVNRTLR
jgi:IS30 family transposase